jgi:uncharacterized membrane protein YphA (DoxX/SURF4 family)
MNLALLVIRIVIGLLFVGHGAQKLFGILGGPGLSGAADMFDAHGFARVACMPWRRARRRSAAACCSPWDC